MMQIGFIGQRFGGSTPESRYEELVDFLMQAFREDLLKYRDVVLHVSTNPGVDLAAIEAAQNLGMDMVLYVPYPNHSAEWPHYWRKVYKRLSEYPRATVVQIGRSFYQGVYDARSAAISERSGGNMWMLWDGLSHVDRGMSKTLSQVKTIRNLYYDWKQK